MTNASPAPTHHRTALLAHQQSSWEQQHANHVVITVSIAPMPLFAHNVSMDSVLIRMELALDALSIAAVAIHIESLIVQLVMKE